MAMQDHWSEDLGRPATRSKGLRGICGGQSWSASEVYRNRPREREPDPKEIAGAELLDLLGSCLIEICGRISKCRMPLYCKRRWLTS